MKDSTFSFWGDCRHWRLLFILGILTVLCGIWFFMQPKVAYTLFSVSWGLSLFIGGMILLVSAYMNRLEKSLGRFGLIVSGGFSMIVGIFLIINLKFTETVLPYIFAFVLLFQGLFNLISSIQMYRNKVSAWWIYLLNSVLLLILSVVFLFYPFSSAVALVFVASIMMIYWGINMILISLDLRPGKSLC